MGGRKLQPWSGAVWELADRQHGVVSRGQLLELGMGSGEIQHRLRAARLHQIWSGVYIVGRPEVSERGRWLAAVLACGPSARLSHRSAAALWGIRDDDPDRPVEVVVPIDVVRVRSGIVVRRRSKLATEPGEVVDGIPVTNPVSMMIDLTACLPLPQLRFALAEASQRGLVDVEQLPSHLDPRSRRPGVGRLRRLLDREMTVLPETVLEERFLTIVRRAGLPLPETQKGLSGHRVDFFWPDLALVVEADSLRYHRTAAKQSADMRRDHDHVSAGRTTLRFSHAQIVHDSKYVATVLAHNIGRLQTERATRP